MPSRQGSNDVGIRGHGFVRDDGVFTTIDVPGASYTGPSGINNRGQIVGGYLDAGGTAYGFLLDNGTFTMIDAPGASGTVPFGINERGQIVGLYSCTSRRGNKD